MPSSRRYSHSLFKLSQTFPLPFPSPSAFAPDGSTGHSVTCGNGLVDLPLGEQLASSNAGVGAYVDEDAGAGIGSFRQRDASPWASSRHHW